MIPVMTGYLVLGFGFGILSEKNGYGILWALAMMISPEKISRKSKLELVFTI